jgi:hypothetical protein
MYLGYMQILSHLFYLLYFLMGLRFELRVLCSQSRYSITWAMPPVHFVLVILEMGSWELFAWAGLKQDQVARITSVSHQYPATFFFFFWHKVSLCRPDGPQICDPPDSTSWVLELQICYHHTWHCAILILVATGYAGWWSWNQPPMDTKRLILFLLLLLVFGSIGVWIQGFRLLDKCSIMSHNPSPSCFHYFLRSLTFMPGLAWITIPLLMLSL